MTTEVIRLARRILGIEPGIMIRSDHTTTVRSCKRQTIAFFTGFGYPMGRKSATVTIPEVIFLSRPRIKRGFLRGLFSADGCFYKEGFRGGCRLEVVSKPLRDGFILLASHLHFNFRRYSYFHHGGHNKLPLHLAYLGRQEEVRRWMREIGSICDTHIRKYRSLMRSLEHRKSSRKHF